MPTPTSVIITANGTQTAAINTAYKAVTAQLRDENGIGIPGESLTMDVTTGWGQFAGGGTSRTGTTDAAGKVIFTQFVASSKLGNFEPTVRYPALVRGRCFFTNIDPNAATSVAVSSGNNQSAPASSAFGNPLVARVANAVNAPVPGVNVVFDAPNAGASLIWTLPATDPVSATTDASGLATTPTFAANATPGTYNVTATAAGVAGNALFQLTNGAAPPLPQTSSLQMCEV